MSINKILVVVSLAVLLYLPGCAKPEILASVPIDREDVSSVASQAGPVSVQSEDFSVTEQAELLTKHLLEGAFCNENVNWKAELDSRELDNFVMTTARYSQDPRYTYYGIVRQGELYEFPLDSVSQMMYEVFGIENWKPQSDNLIWNEEKQAYVSGLEFGVGGAFSYKEMTSIQSPRTGTVETTFLLTDATGFKGEPGWEEYGYYAMTFRVMNENGQDFLRFVQMKSLKLESASCPFGG